MYFLFLFCLTKKRKTYYQENRDKTFLTHKKIPETRIKICEPKKISISVRKHEFLGFYRFFNKISRLLLQFPCAFNVVYIVKNSAMHHIINLKYLNLSNYKNANYLYLNCHYKKIINNVSLNIRYKDTRNIFSLFKIID